MDTLLVWAVIVAIILLISYANTAAQQRARRRRRCPACRQEKRIRVGQWRDSGGYRRLTRGELYQLKRGPQPTHTCKLNRKQMQARARVLSRQYGHQRRALLAGSRGSYTPAEWADLLGRFDECPDCHRRWSDIPPPPGRSSPITVDHIQPLARGGRNDIFNLQPLCYSCNSRKGTKLIEYPLTATGGGVPLATETLSDELEAVAGGQPNVADPPFPFSSRWSEVNTTKRDGTRLLGRGYDVRLGRRAKSARYALVTKVAGVTYQNPGIRASAFAVGKAVLIRADTNNALYPHAVGVWDASGRIQAGYLPKEAAPAVATLLAGGTTLYGLSVWEWIMPGGQRVGLKILVSDGPPVPR